MFAYKDRDRAFGEKKKIFFILKCILFLVFSNKIQKMIKNVSIVIFSWAMFCQVFLTKVVMFLFRSVYRVRISAKELGYLILILCLIMLYVLKKVIRSLFVRVFELLSVFKATVYYFIHAFFLYNGYYIYFLVKWRKFNFH